MGLRRYIRKFRKRRALSRARRLAKSVFLELSQKLVIVDVGAQGLEGHIYQPLLDAGLVDRVIGFEPLEDLAKRRNEADRRADIRPVALGNGGEETLHVNNMDVTSSLLPLNPDVTKRFVLLSDLETVSKLQVQTVRLSDVELPEIIDLVKLDVQGFEQIILEHSGTAIERTLVLMTEVEFQEIYKGQPLFDTLFAWVRSRGFTFHSLIDEARLTRYRAAVHGSRLPPSTLIWADAVFLNDTGPDTPEALLRKAAIMSLVFGAMDEAYELLLEYDKQCGSARAADFIELI